MFIGEFDDIEVRGVSDNEIDRGFVKSMEVGGKASVEVRGIGYVAVIKEEIDRGRLHFILNVGDYLVVDIKTDIVSAKGLTFEGSSTATGE